MTENKELAETPKQEQTRQDVESAFENLLTIQRAVNEKIVVAQESGDRIAMQVATLIGLTALKEAFTEAAMPAVMQVAGTQIGFRTDQDIDGGGTNYGTLTVRDVVLAAQLRGLEILGNQFNILVGGLYITLEGYTFLLEQLPYLSDLDICVGSPEDLEIMETPSNNGKFMVFNVYGFVPVIIRCVVHGRPFVQSNTNTTELDGRFQVSASGKDKLKTVDSLKSKAEKRARERLYGYLRTASVTAPSDQQVIAPKRVAQSDDADSQGSNESDSSPKVSVKGNPEKGDRPKKEPPTRHTAFVALWRKEMTVKKDAVDKEPSQAAAARLFDLYTKDRITEGAVEAAMLELDVFMGEIKQTEAIGQQYKEKLKRFANAIIEEWAQT